MKFKIYVRCSSVGCKYLSGPFDNLEDANVAARLHETAWFDRAEGQKHKAYYHDLEASAAARLDQNRCRSCGHKAVECDCEFGPA